MNDEAVDQFLQMALRFQGEGRFAEAEQSCRAAIERDPASPRAWQLLGALKLETDQPDAAVTALSIAVTLDPEFAETHDGLGMALMESGQAEAALQAWRRVVELRPDDAQAHQNLALGLRHLGRLDEAIAIWRQAVALQPDVAELRAGLGELLRESGRIDDARMVFAEASAMADRPPASGSAGAAPAPDPPRRPTRDDALAAFARAVEMDPADPIALSNLGTALLDCGRIDEAIAALGSAIAIHPELAVTHNNLGIALREAGRLDQAIASYDRAIAVDPDYGNAHDSRLFALHGHPDYDATRLLAEHLAWNQRFALPLAHGSPRGAGAEDRVPDRQLRIGYVSPDLRQHPVGFFLLPLFEACDRRRFELTCYTDVRVPDQLTRQLQRQVSHWRGTADLSDADLARLIREDRIDILVDLAMHSAGNRLAVFARKPAPVQVTYLAYCSTTGLDAIDWRITDRFLDPPGDGDAAYSERSMRLEGSCYWCYQPATDASGDTDCPPVGPLPAAESGRTTFGCLNDFGKVGRPLLEIWCRLLATVPRSQLVLHAPPGSAREGVRAVFSRAGLDPGRLQFLDRVPLAQYLAAYGGIDVALDTFPYGGGRTTCDALWMGVPVVSLTGRTAVGRGGTSILSHVGLAELVAESPEQYLDIAARLGTDLPRLAGLRGGLRERLQRSPLMDREGFARAMEAAYREMWRQYCAAGA